jgi:Cu+-exporting ATPase
LIKSGTALQTAEKVDTVVLDKTGTLTYGQPELTDIFFTEDTDLRSADLLALAAGAERNSEHPLAEAVVRYAEEQNITLLAPDEFEAVPGKGILARFGGQQLLIGNKALLSKAEGVQPDDGLQQHADSLSQEGKTPLFIVLNGTHVAILAVADKIKPEAANTVQKLQAMGISPIMLTGDNEATGRAIAAQAGIDTVIAQVMPEEKAAQMEKLQREGKTVAMVGDGVNDAPALALADVGMAMGTGIDVAIESGDIVITRGNLDGVVTALALARATMRNIRQNLFWAFVYNIVGIPVAAGLLYIFGGPALSPMLAGGAMALSSVSVVTNALRLRFFKIT